MGPRHPQRRRGDQRRFLLSRRTRPGRSQLRPRPGPHPDVPQGSQPAGPGAAHTVPGPVRSWLGAPRPGPRRYSARGRQAAGNPAAGSGRVGWFGHPPAGRRAGRRGGPGQRRKPVAISGYSGGTHGKGPVVRGLGNAIAAVASHDRGGQDSQAGPWPGWWTTARLPARGRWIPPRQAGRAQTAVNRIGRKTADLVICRAGNTPAARRRALGPAPPGSPASPARARCRSRARRDDPRRGAGPRGVSDAAGVRERATGPGRSGPGGADLVHGALSAAGLDRGVSLRDTGARRPGGRRSPARPAGGLLGALPAASCSRRRGRWRFPRPRRPGPLSLTPD